MEENLYSKSVRNRITRNLGHLTKVKEMIDNGNDFEKVILQLKAVRNSLDSTANAIVAEQAQCAVISALQEENPEIVMDFYKDYSKYF